MSDTSLEGRVMADDLFAQLSQLGGSIPGWGALVLVGGVFLRLGRHMGEYDKGQENQKDENVRLGAALVKVNADLETHRGKTDARLDTHAKELSETRVALAKLPDRDEVRNWFDLLRADIKDKAG